jgi:hypothetical protein
MRTVLGGPSTLEEKEAAERATIEAQLRQARLEVARRTSRWTEIQDDFVPRGRNGYWLVSAASDHVYTRVRGTVFPAWSAAPMADVSGLYFTVDANGELTFYERQPWTWSEHVARQAAKERRRAAPRPRRGTPPR